MTRYHNIGGRSVQYTSEEESIADAEQEEIDNGTSLVIPDIMRQHRDTLLSESDVHALTDRITDEWRTYRQALRDVPSQAGFPNTITWPTKP